MAMKQRLNIKIYETSEANDDTHSIKRSIYMLKKNTESI